MTDHDRPGRDAGGRSRSRRALELAVPALAVAVAIVAPLAVLARLPDPVASHWSVAGQVDGHLPLVVDVILLAATTALVAAVPFAVTRVPVPRAHARLLVATAWSISALLAALRVVTVAANLDAATWRDAGALDLRVAAIVTVVAVLGAAGGWAVAGDRPDLAAPTTRVTAARVPAGAVTVWSGGATNRFGVWSPVLLGAALLATAWFVPPGARVVSLVSAVVAVVAVSTTGEVRVTVGPRGLAVGLGLLGWPRLRVPIEDVEDVTVEDVAPLSYGGWGVRATPGATAVVIRRGTGLRVERRGRRALVVTVEDAATAAAVLLAHRDAAATDAPA